MIFIDSFSYFRPGFEDGYRLIDITLDECKIDPDDCFSEESDEYIFKNVPESNGFFRCIYGGSYKTLIYTHTEEDLQEISSLVSYWGLKNPIKFSNLKVFPKIVPKKRTDYIIKVKNEYGIYILDVFGGWDTNFKYNIPITHYETLIQGERELLTISKYKKRNESFKRLKRFVNV